MDTRLLDKIKGMSPKVWALFGVLILFLILLVAGLILGGKGKVRIKEAEQSFQKPVLQGKEEAEPAGPTTSAEKAKKEEEDILKKKKKFFGKLDDRSLPPLPEPEGPQRFAPVTDPLDKERDEVFAMAYALETKPGKLLREERKETGENQGGEKLPSEIDKRIEKWKLYRAVVRETETSANQPATIVAEITERPLKGILAVGQGQINQTGDRMVVLVNRAVVNGESYQVKGSMLSLDRTAGIVSDIRRNDIARMETEGGMAFGESALNTLREDTTAVTRSPFGGEYVTQQKGANRLREAILAGSSATFGVAKEIVREREKSRPPIEIIVEKGTPIYVRFE